MEEIQTVIRKIDMDLTILLLALFFISLSLCILSDTLVFMYSFFAFLIGGYVLKYLNEAIL